VGDLLVGLRERGLEVTRPILVVIDGAKALRRAVTEVFDHPPPARLGPQRAQRARAIRGGGGEAGGVIACVRKLASASRWESGPGSCQEAR
jgi:hypothetical protein